LQKTEQKQLEKKTENVAVAAQEDTSPEEAPSPPRKKLRFRLMSKPQGSNTYSFAAMVDEPSNASAPSMINRLRGALPAICTAVKQAENSYLNDREWLASWADILREAERQGRAVLRATRSGKVPTVEFDQENDELCRFVQSMESLVRDVGHFSALASLCPSY